MRILYDSNILVRILSRREAIIIFKRDLTENSIVHISSDHILSEVERVLVERMKLTKQKAKAAARLLERQSTIVNPQSIERVSRDPFDDYILAAAVAGKVRYLITDDEDLLVIGEHQGIKIMTLREYQNIT
jgi:putative PIN family toxin of toxin-antitoxin system